MDHNKDTCLQSESRNKRAELQLVRLKTLVIEFPPLFVSFVNDQKVSHVLIFGVQINFKKQGNLKKENLCLVVVVVVVTNLKAIPLPAIISICIQKCPAPRTERAVS